MIPMTSLTTWLDEELAETQAEYKEFYDFNYSIYITLDFNYTIQKLNFKAAALLGRDRNLLINLSFLNYVTSFSEDVFQRSMQTLKKNKYTQTCQIELIIKGGVRKQVQIESNIDKHHQIQLCLTDITCINQKNHRIACLEKELTLLNQLLNYAEDAIAALDENLYFKIVNQSFYNQFLKIFCVQIRPGHNLEKSLMYLSELKPKIIKACNEAFLGKKSKIIIENRNYNFEVYYYYEIIIYSLSEELNDKQLIFRIRDLTDYKAQERMQHQQQSQIALSCKISTMGEMVSALAHEINQPLTVINAYSKSISYLTESELSAQSKLKKIKYPLEQIAIQAEHADKIIHGMKNLLRNEKLETEATDINFLIEETISILNYELLDFKIKIKLLLANNLPIIMMNKIQIMQVILNLARNSIEALQTHQTTNPGITIETCKLKQDIMVTVHDNGPGIPLEAKNKILNTYFTTKSQGTGIGLGICRSLIERHGGILNILQTDTVGATFYFTLPINSQ